MAQQNRPELAKSATAPDMNGAVEIVGLWLAHGQCFNNGAGSIVVGQSVSVALISGIVVRMWLDRYSRIFLEMKGGEWLILTHAVTAQFATPAASDLARGYRR